MAGGVSKNVAVIRHLEELLNTRILICMNIPICIGAIGACYYGLEEKLPSRRKLISSLDEILLPDDTRKAYFHPPLALTTIPDILISEVKDSWIFKPVVSSHPRMSRLIFTLHWLEGQGV